MKNIKATLITLALIGAQCVTAVGPYATGHRTTPPHVGPYATGHVSPGQIPSDNEVVKHYHEIYGKNLHHGMLGSTYSPSASDSPTVNDEVWFNDLVKFVEILAAMYPGIVETLPIDGLQTVHAARLQVTAEQRNTVNEILNDIKTAIESLIANKSQVDIQVAKSHITRASQSLQELAPVLEPVTTK